MVKDSPGFVQIDLLPMINEAIETLSQGVADVYRHQIMKLGMGHPMGPLRLADLMGLMSVYRF